MRLLEKVKIEVGEVRPFTVSAEAANALQSGRRIVLSFSKPLSEELDGAKLERWVSVTPAPSGMKMHVEHMRIGISGAYELGTEYRVTVHAGLPGAEAVVLPRGFSYNLVFRPVAPQLGFERFSTHQLRAGHGRFHLLAVNVPRIRLTAKLFTPEVLPLAAQAYGHSRTKLPPEVRGETFGSRKLGTT